MRPGLVGHVELVMHFFTDASGRFVIGMRSAPAVELCAAADA
jgi:hypothetical protein